MATKQSTQDLQKLVINKVPDLATFHNMETNNQINANELYLIEEQERAVTSVATGSTNGTITVEYNDGSSQPVSVYGLGSNAYTSTTFAPLNSPALTGNPTAPNPTGATSIANKGYVDDTIAAHTAAHAVHAGSAGYATEAVHAITATWAGSASYAQKANSASYATLAGTANFAKTAQTAAQAVHAGAADVADLATTATNAVYAASAGYAATADTSNTSGTASWAITANHARYAGTANNAVTAGNAITAGYAGSALKDGSNNVISETYATKSELNALLGGADAMVFKGTIGTNGDISSVPTSGYQAGHTYRVITANTYAGQKCEVGDLLIAIADGPASGTTVNNNHWTVAQTNIDGAVTTTQNSATSGSFAIFTGTNGKQIVKAAGVGSATKPIYINSNGVPSPITSYEGKANTAGTADYAKLAGTATFALSATCAANATNAGNANYAGTATYAKSAMSAANATNAGNANYAGTATYAINAGDAVNATNASYAGTATYALSAGSADYATNASNADYAGTATFAKSATSAANATKAGSANLAGTATYAISAGSAAFATNATNATNANSAITATRSVYAATAGYAGSANTSNTSGTATFARGAGTAAYASSAGYATSSSYATTAGNATDNTKVAKTGDIMTGSLTLSTTANGASPALIFQRGTLTDSYNDWQIQNSGGLLYFGQRGSGSTAFDTNISFNNQGQISAKGFLGQASCAAYAGSAGVANSASYAGSASYAANANKANSATTASNAVNAGAATTASNAVNASEAVHAGSAGYAANANTSNYAVTAANALKVNGHSVAVDVPSGAKFTDTWNANSLGVAGYVAAPTTSTTNKVWKTDANGNPAWRDDTNTQYSALTQDEARGGTATTAKLITAAVLRNSYTAYSNSAGYAGLAGTATYAKGAGTASYASSATFATNATNATESAHAGTAIYATSAGYAGTANTSNTSGTATFAKGAGTAQYASSAGYATKAGSAGYATTASQATYAGSASYAANASSANTSGKLSATQLTNQDLDTLKDNDLAIYWAAGSNTVTNKPTGVDAFGLRVHRAASGWYVQELFASNSQEKTYIRYFNASSWTAWKLLQYSDGTGASGTWGISISGKAGSANYATSAGSAGYATTSLSASSAAFANSATCASNATHAGSATFATTANYSVTATNAKFATTSNYAGSAGFATTATCLTTNAGSATQPVYFSGGKPVVANAYSSLLTSVAWTGGTAAGPTVSVTVGGTTKSAAIPAATTAVSGIITTTTQGFNGNKTFVGDIFKVQANEIRFRNTKQDNSAAGTCPYVTSLAIGDSRETTVDEYGDGYLAVHSKSGLLLHTASTDIQVYSNTATYNVGAIVWYNRAYYRCTTAITEAQEWTAANWQNISTSAQQLKTDATFLPVVTETKDIGSTSLRWNNIYARNGNLSGTLLVSGATTHSGAVNIVGDTTVAKFKATGASTFGAAVNVAGATTLASTLSVTGATTHAGAVNIVGDTTVAKFKATGAATFGAAVAMASTLAVTGAATYSGAVNVVGKTTVAGGLVGTANLYGATLPTSGVEGQVFFQASNGSIYEIPTGGTKGQALIKNSTTDRDVTWGDVGGKQKPGTTKFYPSGSTSTTANSDDAVFNTNVYVQSNVLYGACWNDYAEFRQLRENIEIPYGYCVCENGDDTLSLSTERMQPAPAIVSDTFGYAIGETENAKAPIAVSGRVLVYPYEDRNNYKPGDCVCAGPEGKVCIMTREEIKEYPDRIVGIVSAIPSYDIWGQNDIQVNGRIWVKVR